MDISLQSQGRRKVSQLSITVQKHPGKVKDNRERLFSKKYSKQCKEDIRGTVATFVTKGQYLIANT